MNTIPTLPAIATPFTDRLYEFARQEQAERITRRKIVLRDEDYRTIAKAIREKENIERAFENGRFYDCGEIKLMIRGTEIYVFYEYQATGEIYEDRHGYADHGEKEERIYSEEISGILCEASEDTCDIVFDEKKLIQYFNEPLLLP